MNLQPPCQRQGHQPPHLILDQAAQRGCGCPIPEGVQGQFRWCPGPPGLVLNGEVGGPAFGRGVADS